MIATKRLINSVWTMEYEIRDDEAYIISYDRTNQKGYDQEHTAPKLELDEDSERTIVGIWIDEKYYNVINCKHIFDYGV